MKVNKKGFSVVEILMVIVIIGLIGAVIWLVFNRQKTSTTDSNETGNTQQVTANETNESQEESEPNPTEGWQTFKDSNGNFSFKYPSNWVFASNPETCSEGLLLFGVKMSGGQSSAGRCASDGARAFGQMSVSLLADRADLSLCGLSTSWNTDSKESVKVAGVSAVKTTGTYIDNDEDQGGNAKGDKTVQYCFVANNQQYIIRYTKMADYPDALDDFNLMVTKTFSI